MLKQTSPNELIALKLLDAQALVERGWERYNYTSSREWGMHTAIEQGPTPGECFCAMGALAIAYQQIPYDEKAPGIGDAVAYLRAAANIEDIFSVSSWNRHASSAEEVAMAFGKAAELARVSA